MKDLSLNIMDIIENSVSAKATEIKIMIEVMLMRNKLHINIQDNGIGMDEELVEMVQNPFYTSKTHRTKKIGLGIPFFKQNVELCNGTFSLHSQRGKGTKIDVVMDYDHIDRMPLGNLADTFCSVIIGHPEIDFELELKRIYLSREKVFHFSTIEMRETLGEIPFTYPDVIRYIQNTIKNGIKKIELEER